MRLVDADVLKTKMVYSKERHEKVVPVAEIDWMPTVDAVEVVRCGKCREWTQTAGDDESGLGRCDFLKHDLVMSRGFCAWGRRKDDAAD